MKAHEWVKEFSGAVTICNPNGIILEMNDQSARTFAKDGGYDLIGQNLFDCHPEPARSKLVGLLAEQKVNTYTIEKNGVKKLIHQSPWYRDGQYAGFVEIVFEIPLTMPHFVRSS